MIILFDQPELIEKSLFEVAACGSIDVSDDEGLWVREGREFDRCGKVMVCVREHREVI